MRRWIGPLLVGTCVTFAAYYLALVAAPRVLMAAAVKRVGAGGINRMTHAPLATDRSRAVIRPSPDLAYSACPFDLGAGPLRIHVPPVPSPYWSLSVFDARTDAAFVRNNRDTGGKGLDVVVATNGQPTPPGARVIRVDGAKGIALVRILVEDRARFATVDAARRAATCAPA